MKSIREELDELESRLDAARERTRKIGDEHSTAQFTGDQMELEQLRDNLTREIEETDAMKSQMAEIQASFSSAMGKMRELERTVFGLSTSALALTVTFRSSLIPDVPNDLDLLRLAWIFFTVSVIAFPFGALANVSMELGVPPRWLFRFLDRLISPIGFACFMLGVLDFLRFALANLPTT